jgi:hypothetical protein
LQRSGGILKKYELRCKAKLKINTAWFLLIESVHRFLKVAKQARYILIFSLLEKNELIYLIFFYFID